MTLTLKSTRHNVFRIIKNAAKTGHAFTYKVGGGIVEFEWVDVVAIDYATQATPGRPEYHCPVHDLWLGDNPICPQCGDE